MNHGHPVPLLELRHVSVTEGLSGRPLVQDVSFSLQRGHCLGIVGESGSGKSLLCRALLGLLPSGLVRSGQLHFDGRDLGRLDPAGWRELRGTGMAVILQQAMTAFDPLRPLGKQLEGALRDRGRMSAARAREAVCEALQRVDLPETVLGSYPHQLSGGMKQRVGIARAFVSKPRVIFADEPTGNLDSITSKQVLYRMLQISKQMGTTFVMVTHEPELASCADRIITILDGKVQSDVVQDPATRERNREALFASLEGNMRIGGDSASGEVHQKTAAELASYAAPAAAAQQPEQPKP